MFILNYRCYITLFYEITNAKVLELNLLIKRKLL